MVEEEEIVHRTLLYLLPAITVYTNTVGFFVRMDCLDRTLGGYETGIWNYCRCLKEAKRR